MERVAYRRDNLVRQLVAFFTFPLRNNFRSRFDLCTQFIHRKGLFDVAGNSQFLGLRYGSVIGSRGEHDERNIRVSGTDLPEHFQACHHRHFQNAKDQIVGIIIGESLYQGETVTAVVSGFDPCEANIA